VGYTYRPSRTMSIPTRKDIAKHDRDQCFNLFLFVDTFLAMLLVTCLTICVRRQRLTNQPNTHRRTRHCVKNQPKHKTPYRHRAALPRRAHVTEGKA